MPTKVRSSAMGSCSLVARFGGMLAPTVSSAFMGLETFWLSTNLKFSNVFNSSLALPYPTHPKNLKLFKFLSFQLSHLNHFWPYSTYATVASLGFMNFLVSYMWLVETKGVTLDTVKLDDKLLEQEAHLATHPEELGLLNGGEKKPALGW